MLAQNRWRGVSHCGATLERDRGGSSAGMATTAANDHGTRLAAPAHQGTPRALPHRGAFCCFPAVGAQVGQLRSAVWTVPGQELGPLGIPAGYGWHLAPLGIGNRPAGLPAAGAQIPIRGIEMRAATQPPLNRVSQVPARRSVRPASGARRCDLAQL